MDNKYFELADTVLPLIFKNRHKDIGTLGILYSDTITDKILLKQLLTDLHSFGIITSSPSLISPFDRIHLTSLGLKLAPTLGAYRQFVEGQSTDKQNASIKIDMLHIDNSISHSSLRNFKSTEVVATTPPRQNEIKPKSIWSKIVHSWLTYVIGVLVGLTVAAITQDWFNIMSIIKTK